MKTATSFRPRFLSSNIRKGTIHAGNAQRVSYLQFTGDVKRRAPGRVRADSSEPAADSGRTARVWDCKCGGARSVSGDLYRGREAGAGRDDAGRPRAGCEQLAHADGAQLRTPR